MSNPLLVGVYQPGASLLHRLPVGAKLGGLAVLSLMIVLVRDARAAVVFLGVALALAALGRAGLRMLARTTRAVLLIAVIAGALQWWVSGPAKAVATAYAIVPMAIIAVRTIVEPVMTAGPSAYGTCFRTSPRALPTDARRSVSRFQVAFKMFRMAMPRSMEGSGELCRPSVLHRTTQGRGM